MIRARKIRLEPNNKQRTKLFACAGVARWAYNWALEQQETNGKNGGTFISHEDLRKRLTALKRTRESTTATTSQNKRSKTHARHTNVSFKGKQINRGLKAKNKASHRFIKIQKKSNSPTRMCISKKSDGFVFLNEEKFRRTASIKIHG